MAFTVRNVMDQHLCFVVACRESGDPMRVLCERHGISRKKRYKWLSRYEASGAAGLEDRSRAPHHRPAGLDEAISGPILRLQAAHPTQQAVFDRWRQIYNEFRPHEALGQTCPADHHHPSPRPYPERLQPWEYPEDHWVERVSLKGYIKWEGELIYLTEALAGESVGIAKNDQHDWVIRFRNIDMAILPKNSRKIRNSDPAGSGRIGTNRESCHPCRRSKVLPIFPVEHPPRPTRATRRRPGCLEESRVQGTLSPAGSRAAPLQARLKHRQRRRR